MSNSAVRQLLRVIALAILMISFNSNPSASAAVIVPSYFFPLAAPWPAGVTLHASGDGYGYGPGPTGTTHTNLDMFAMDFNGYADEKNPPVETADKDLLVLAVADGCVKEVKYYPGHFVEKNDGNGVKKQWIGSYGWSVVISHPGGYESRYAHLKATPLVPMMSYDPNQCYFVAQGQPLGQIGGTGTTPTDSAIHLHLAMYYCEKPGSKCKTVPAKPEPLDGVSDLPSGLGTRVKVTSKNYGVGYEAIQEKALTNPAGLAPHTPIQKEYQRWNGQYGFFGRAKGPVRSLPGTDIFYQEFEPHALMSTIASTIVEVNFQAYMLPQAIWDLFRQNYARYGNPVTAGYLSQVGDELGWRVDFQNASVFWNDPKPMVWDANNASWKVSFCPGTNDFGCNSVKRRDPYPDFTFPDSNRPGPMSRTEGFSMLIEASFAEKLISKISLEYELQGNARFYVENNYQGDWIRSEDEPIQGVTAPKWHVGGNTFAVRFWQSPGKPALLKLKIHERGIGVPIAQAFESEGTLVSSAFQPAEPEYIDFEPPPYPADAGSEEIPSTETEPGQPTEIAPDTRDSLPFEVPDIGKWWDETVKKIEHGLKQWSRDVTRDLQKRLEEELLRILQEALDSLARQCSGSSMLALAVGVGVILRKRFRR